MTDLKKSVDLANISRRALSAWQYIDTKMTTESFSTMELDCPYPSSSFTNSFLHPIHSDTEVTKDWKCTKFIVENDHLTTMALGLLSTTTVKNFFNLNGKNLPFKKKQLIYWQIRLRYACGIIPISILKMVSDLKKLGYGSWKLPNGEIVPFSSAWLGDIVVVPKRYNVVETKQSYGKEHMTSIIEPIEGFSGVAEEGPFVQHSVIMIKSADGKIFVFDSTSLQFSMEGENSSLVYFSSWDEYVEKFPGTIIATSLGDGKDAINRLNTKWDIGNTGFKHCEKLIKAIMKDFHQPACDHCGEVSGTAIRNIHLQKCSSCKKVSYCDKLCQKTAWKSHKDLCSKIGS